MIASRLAACGLIAASTFAGAALLTAAPALALDDGQQSIFSSVYSLIDIDPAKPGGDISYRERPPLVLPPKMQLRQPAPGAAGRNAAWPQDADLVRRQREAAASSASRLEIFKRNDLPVGQEELRSKGIAFNQPPRARDKCEDDPTKGNCIYTKWEDLAGQKFVNPEGGSETVVGQEPPRKALTDPPRGYRTPS